MSESGALIPFWKDRVMAKPYSDDLRVRAIAIVEGGASRHEVAALLEVSPSSVINWLRRWSDDGSSAAKPSGGSRMVKKLKLQERRAVIPSRRSLTACHPLRHASLLESQIRRPWCPQERRGAIPRPN
jgi:transposase